MKRALAATGALLALAGHASAKPTAHGAARPPAAPSHAASTGPARVALTGPARVAPPAPLAPLPMLPRVARVRVQAARDHVVLVEEVNLPRGDWQSGGLDFYVAFGSPGPPIAVDAHLVPISPGLPESRLEDTGEAVTVEPAVRRGPGTHVLLGAPQMAGVIVHVKESALRQALALGDVAALRIRSLLKAPNADAEGARSLVVRLGIAEGLPMTLGRVQVASMEQEPWIVRVQSRLCGPDADPWPLTTALFPRAAARKEREPPSIATEMAVRHATDDLCVRWWGH